MDINWYCRKNLVKIQNISVEEFEYFPIFLIKASHLMEIDLVKNNLVKYNYNPDISALEYLNMFQLL